MTPPSTASPIVAVGAVIWNPQGEVLLVGRARPPRMGEWSIPGGKVDMGESLREALLREVREETGIDIEIAGLIDVVEFIAAEENERPGQHYVLIDFSARWLKGEVRPASDAKDARWVRPAALDRYEMWEETRRIIALSARAMGIAD